MPGPRARRRLVWIVGVALGAVVLAGVIRPFTTSSGSSPRQKEALGAPEDLGIPYGASPSQVLRRLGRPNGKRPGCWIYRVRNGAQEIGDGFGQWVDAVEYCFAEGPTGGRAVSLIQSHFVARTIGRKRYPADWAHVVVMARKSTGSGP